MDPGLALARPGMTVRGLSAQPLAKAGRIFGLLFVYERN
jgi:hypothetical protein